MRLRFLLKLEHSLLNPDVLDKIREECANARRYCVARFASRRIIPEASDFAGFERKGMRGDWFCI